MQPNNCKSCNKVFYIPRILVCGAMCKQTYRHSPRANPLSCNKPSLPIPSTPYSPCDFNSYYSYFLKYYTFFLNAVSNNSILRRKMWYLVFYLCLKLLFESL